MILVLSIILGSMMLFLQQPANALTENVHILYGSANTASCSTGCLQPQVAYINTGDTVTWSNDDYSGHTITSGQPSDSQTGNVFDSSTIAEGQSWSFTFNDPGTYNYFDQIHPWITGEVVVYDTTQSCVDSLHVDQSSYNWGDTITLSYSLPSNDGTTKAVITAVDPAGHVPFIGTYYPTGGYSYTLKIPTASSDWYTSGNYYIKIDLGYCNVTTTLFNFNVESTSPASTDSQCFSWNANANTGSQRWDTYITNTCNYTVRNVYLWNAWDAGYGKVWSQNTYGPFDMQPGWHEHVWQYISLPPTGHFARSWTQISADNAATQTARGNQWLYVQ